MRCPICQRPTEAAWKPFCSRRCADVDLGRWLTGGYAIPVADDADEDGTNGGGDPEMRDGGRPATPPGPRRPS